MLKYFQVPKILDKEHAHVNKFEIGFFNDNLFQNDKGEIIVDQNGDFMLASKDLVDLHFVKRTKRGDFKYSKNGYKYSKAMSPKNLLKKIYKNFHELKVHDVLFVYDDGEKADE